MAIKITSDKGKNLEIQEVELDRESGLFEQSWDVNEEIDNYAVLVEILSGNAEVMVEGGRGQQVPSRLEKVRMFVGGFGQGARNLLVRVRASAESKIRVTVVLLGKHIGEAFEKLPCKLCKALCRVAVSLLLAYLGVPFLDAGHAGGSLELPEHQNFIEGMLSRNPDGPLAPFFVKIDPTILRALRTAFETVQWVLETPDKFYTMACEFAGCCPKVSANA